MRFPALISLLVLSVLASCTGPGAPNPPISSAPNTPQPDANGSFKAVPASSLSALLAWKATPGAVSYQLKRDGKALIEAEDTQTLFRDDALKPATAYTYSLISIGAARQTLETRTVNLTTPAGSGDRSNLDLPPPDAALSRAYVSFNWTPGAQDTAGVALHSSFWTYGPDNKVYPTWHPNAVTDSSGKVYTFGHEHGQDPQTSSLYATTGQIPFGYINEQLEPGNPSLQRNEDHVGHKIFIGTVTVDATIDAGKPSQRPTTTTCDVMSKLHMGTHSPDALKNNLHEIFWNIRCDKGLELRFKAFSAIGAPGGFRSECNGLPKVDYNVGTPAPANSPNSGGGQRILPTDTCINTAHYADESWQNGVGMGYHVNQPAYQGGMVMGIGPYFKVKDPSRYYSTGSNSSSRVIDLCYDAGSGLYQNAECVAARAAGRLSWDDPRSPFKGAVRSLDFTGIGLRNNLPNSRWYTDVYGGSVQPDAPDAVHGVIVRQYASANISLDLGPTVFPQQDFSHQGVHAPN